jgi:hypothetical protein
LEEKAQVITEDGFTEIIDQLVADNPGRRFFVTPLVLRESIVAGTDKGVYRSTKYDLKPAGLLFEIVAKGQSTEPETAAYDFVFRQSFTKEDPFFLERNYTGLFDQLRREYADAWLSRALYWQDQGQLVEAENGYRQAAELGPKNSGVYVQRLGIFLAEQGRDSEAESYFNLSLIRSPNDSGIVQNVQLFQQQLAEKQFLAQNPSQNWKLSIWPVEGGVITGKLPPSWLAELKDGEVVVAPSEGGVSMAVSLVPITDQAAFTSWFSDSKTEFGTVLDTGNAQLPGIKTAFIRIWQAQDNTKTNEFIIPQTDGLLRIVVKPGESQWQETVNALLISFMPQFDKPEELPAE